MSVQLSIAPDGRGLSLPPDLDFEAWEQLGVKLGRVASASTWAVADWALFGARKFAHGSRYTKAIEATGLAYETLKNYASIAKRFPIDRRSPSLSFAHHAAVVALPELEATTLLNQAEEHGWSLRRLRDAVRAEARLQARRGPGSRARRKGEQLALDAGDDAEPAKVTIGLTLEREQRWKAAAHARGLDLRDWLIDVADAAATAARAA